MGTNNGKLKRIKRQKNLRAAARSNRSNRSNRPQAATNPGPLLKPLTPATNYELSLLAAQYTSKENN